MKIVFLAPFGIRPKGTLIARMIPLAAALQDVGHTVVIIAPPYTNPEDSGRSEIVNGVIIRNILLGPRNKMLAAPLLAGRMFRAALSEQPNLIHLFKPKGYGGLAAMLLLLLKRVGLKMPPLLIDTDDWEGKGGMNELHPYSPAERIFFQFQEKWLLLRAAAVTVASRALQTIAWSMGIQSERVLYLPNCVDEIPAADGAAVRVKLGISSGAPVVLLYTRFFEFSQDTLHSLFKEIYTRVPDVRFLVVGTGRTGEESLLIDFSQSHGFVNAMVMAGWLDPVDIPSYLAAADVALYPFSDSLINRSKCPAKLTEILRSGVPVVADNVGQLSEYIKQGVSGILCDPDNWHEMADAAVRLLCDRKASRSLGAAGRSYVLDNFVWKIFAARLDALYQSVAVTHNEGNSL